MKKLRSVLAAALILALASALPANPRTRCEATESQLLGNWKGGNSFQEMAFERDSDGRRFNSWLHHRPVQFGLNWTLADCDLKIMDRENKIVVYRFQVKHVNRSRLVLINVEDGLIEKYRRIS